MKMIEAVKNKCRNLAGSYETDKYGFFKDTLQVIEQLETENKQLKEKIVRSERAERIVICKKCGKEFHTFAVLDCPDCERVRNEGIRQSLKGE